MRKVAAVTGRDLRSARPSVDENNRPAVSFTLSTEGGRKFGKVTRREHRPAAGDHPRRPRAVGADASRAASRPTAASPAASRRRRSQNLSLILRSGALPATLTYLEEQTIGPTPRRRLDPLRRRSRRSVGLLLVIVFMLVYYKLSGVNAVVALIFNLVILLGLMAYIGAVMTLPGIAGFVLTMGIGVDSNVLIFERIKEELEAQRGVRASINAGFSRVFWTLFDTHIAALISVRVPVPVRHRPDPRLRRDAGHRSGRRTCSRRFSCRRRCSSWRSASRQQVADAVASKPCISSRTPTSTSCAGAGTRSCCRGSSSSPARVDVRDQGHSARRRVRRRHRRSSSSSTSRSSVQQVRAALDKNFPGGGQNAVVQAYGDPAQHQVMIRVPQVGAESGTSLSTTAQQVEDALQKGEPRQRSRATAPRSSARRSAQELTQQGLLGDGAVARSASSPISRSASSSASASARSSRRFTTC